MSFVTLLTDFGSTDYYASLLKAEILKAAPQSRIVDISHDIAAQDIMEGAFFLKSVAMRFPKGSIHIGLVNTYYKNGLQLIYFEYDGHFFFGPNNGLFSLVFPDLDSTHVFNAPFDKYDSIYETTAQAVKQLFSDSITSWGNPLDNLETRLPLQPVITSDQIRATIVYIDHFGNVIVNLDKESFERVRNGRDYSIFYKSKDPVTKLSNGYHEVGLAEVCAFFNEINMLEIAVNMGNAHELLNLNKNETIQINFY